MSARDSLQHLETSPVTEQCSSVQRTDDEIVGKRPTDQPTVKGDNTRRRQFLRTTATLAIVGSLSGCLDELTDVELDDGVTDDELDDGVTDDGSADANGEPADGPEGELEREIHDQVNAVRRDHDRDPLGYDDDVAAVARRHSVDMVEREYFSHVSPDGERPSDRLAEFHPAPCRMIGENIANVFRRPDDEPEAIAARAVDGWMQSEGHRENILREEFDQEGIGVAFGEDDRVLVTQKFCGTEL